jgi:hypothetical protein
MTELLQSKKMVLSLVGIGAVIALVLAGHELETVKWVGGFIAGIVASLNLGKAWPTAFPKDAQAPPAGTAENRCG